MSKEQFDEPRVAINRVYTRQGDQGLTALAGGQRIPKDSPRIEAYGTVDELNAFIGVARATVAEIPALAEFNAILLRVQHELFNLGSILATLPADVHPHQARVTDDDVLRLEAEMDKANEDLPPLRSFVLPGGSRLNAELHVCRTVCRRAERACVAFVWSRWVSRVTGAPETLWQPNQ
jgi:cob(I)alamin adenosyltransferase